MTEVSDFLKSSSGDLHPGFKFENVGDTIRGTICEEPRVVETPNLSDGKPEKKLVVAVQTDAGETWSVWIRRGFMARAINDAIEAAGTTGLAEGGQIAVKYSEDRDTGKPSKAKIFVAKYTPPAPSTVSVNDL
jgi:hypothetical protein